MSTVELPGSTPVTPIGRQHSPLNNLLAEAIREAIVTRRYAPGERLVEGRLAEDFGVSRIPVREALRVLASQGLVELEPRKGASVATLSHETAMEMVEVRATLEGLNARLAARHRTPALIERLQDVLQQGTRAAQAGSPETLARLNDAYHDLLAEAGMNRILGDLMRALRMRTSMYFAAPQQVAERSWRDHAAILQAVMDGDEELAALLASRHVTEAGRTFLAGEPT